MVSPCVSFRPARQRNLDAIKECDFVMDLKIFLSAIVAPAALLLLAFAVRAYKGAPQSATTDIYALFIILDIAIIADTNSFAAPVLATLKPVLPVMAAIALAAEAIAWFCCIRFVEAAILKHYEKKAPLLPAAIQGTLAWIGSLTTIVTHVMVLTGRALPWL